MRLSCAAHDCSAPARIARSSGRACREAWQEPRDELRSGRTVDLPQNAESRSHRAEGQGVGGALARGVRGDGHRAGV